MASKRDVHSYCNAKENESKRSGISTPEIIITATDNASPVGQPSRGLYGIQRG